MRVNFRQGVVSYPASGGSQDFLIKSGSYVSLNTTNGLVSVNFAHGTQDYLYIERNDVNNAWTITPSVDQWLYWDIDLRTGLRTFGTTLLEPKVQASAPTSPSTDQHWFNTSSTTMYVWSGLRWVEKVRVFACELQGGATIISTSINSPNFDGTQVGNTTQVYVGEIMFDAQTSNPFKTPDGKFVTTEDTISTPSVKSDVKFASLIVSGQAQQVLSAYTVVKFSDFGQIEHADQYTSQQQTFGIIQEDANISDFVNVVMSGAVTNPTWNWSTVNQKLYADSAGALTETAPIPSAVPVAVVVDANTIVLGTMSVEYSTTNITNPSPDAATDSTAGLVKINIPAVDPLSPVVIGANDPRIDTVDAIDSSADGILVKTGSSYAPATTSTIKALVDTEYVNITGDTMTGSLVLYADPTDALEAATKNYVDVSIGALSAVYSSLGHTHPESDIVNLVSDLASKVDIAGSTMTGALILSGDPTVALQAATKQYVDSIGYYSTSNVVRVNKAPNVGEYSSIKAAMDSISGNTSTNRWVVEVAPGTYAEDKITMKMYTSFRALSTRDVIVIANNPADDLVVTSGYNTIDGLTLTGARNTGSRAILAQDVTDVAILNCSFEDNSTDIHVEAVSATTSVDIHMAEHNGGPLMLYGTRCISSGGNTCTVSISGSELDMEVASPNLVAVADYTGTGTTVISDSISYVGGSIGTGVLISDGATVRSGSTYVSSFDVNLHVPNVGSAPQVNINEIASNSVTYDIFVEHPGTSGTIVGSAQRSKVYIDPSAPLSVQYYSSQGLTLVGEVFIGTDNSSTTNISRLVQKGGPVGALSGGEVTKTATPLQVSIAAGYGYVDDATTNLAKYVEWTTQTLTLPDNTSILYVYVDNTGAIAYATAPTDPHTTILLSRARTFSSTVQFIIDIRYMSEHAATGMDTFARSAFGPIFESGCVTAENGTTPFELDVGSGSYWYGSANFLPSGGSPITFTQFNRVSGSWVPTAGVTLVENTQYDNGTDLTALTAGYYTKHALYVGGDGANETYALIVGQAEYATLLDVQQAPLPTPPSYFSADAGVAVAAIIVQEGAAAITEIDDIRPRLGFTAPAITSVYTHGNLLGLLADDHPQYLRTDGGRTMTGSLNLGTNNILNAGTINGVTIQTHVSRHLPNGSDPLTTAAPTTSLSTVTANSEGTANSLARSDHTHALTGVQPSSTALTTLDGIATTGLYAITGSGTAATRTILGISGSIDVTNGDGVSGNPTLSVSSTYGGQTSIDTVGTLTSGTWNADTLTTPYGGTGLNSIGIANQVLGVNVSASGLEYKTVAGGANISITPTAGLLTVSAYGLAPLASAYVTVGNDGTLTDERALTGTTNQITIADGGANSNVTVAIADNPVLPGTSSVTLPTGTTAQRPVSPVGGMLRHNSTTGMSEHYAVSASAFVPFGKVLQVLTGSIPAATGSTTFTPGATAPTSTTGTQIWSQAITTQTNTSRVSINFTLSLDVTNDGKLITVAIFRGTTCILTSLNYMVKHGEPQTCTISFDDTPGAAGTYTYSARVAVDANTWYVNSNFNGWTLGGTLISKYRLTEVL